MLPDILNAEVKIMKKTSLLSAFLVFGLLAGCSSAKPGSSEHPLSIIELVPEDDKVLVNEISDIQIKTDPSDEQLTDADFDAGGGKVEVDKDTARFSADQAGTYTIQASKDGISSNPVTITVVDDKTASAGSQNGSSDSGSQNQQPDSSGKSAESTDSQNTGSEGQTAPSSSAAKPVETDPRKVPGAISVTDLLNDADNYVGKQVTVYGYFPQDTPATGDARLADGTQLPILMNYAGDEGLPLENAPKDGWGTMSQETGTLKKEKVGNYSYVLDVTSQVALSTGASAGPFNPTAVGDSTAAISTSGLFVFSVDNVEIRNGEDGLESPKSGLTFNAGDSVLYDNVYQKDGYTWISYIGKSGKRHSAAIGDDNTILYGWSQGELKTAPGASRN